LLVTARRRAGLSQRELAERAKTSQSVVARIELGAASPSWDTLARLLAAAGFELDVRLSLRPVKRIAYARRCCADPAFDACGTIS